MSRVLIVCVSVAHGNTRKVAQTMGAELQAEIVPPESVDVAGLAHYDLVGLGSGIFFQRCHRRLRNFVGSLPAMSDLGDSAGPAVFVFATSGFRPATAPLGSQLRRRGYSVAGTFVSRGWDTSPPFGWVGGVGRGRPNDNDLARARDFARQLLAPSGL